MAPGPRRRRRTVRRSNSPIASGQPVFSLRCAERGGLTLQRHGASQASGNLSMTVNVGRRGRDIPAQLIEGGLLRATLTSGDPLIAALGSAATPIGVRAVGAAPLLLPPGPPLSAFVVPLRRSRPSRRPPRQATRRGKQHGSGRARRERRAAGDERRRRALAARRPPARSSRRPPGASPPAAHSRGRDGRCG